jgi:16S rRNA (guanine527-N7)-methyltransferase
MLADGLDQLGITASALQIHQWQAYIDLLVKWNKAYNLTAVRDKNAMIHRHLLDSLSVASHITSQSLLDVGAGAGLPSIPLAILWPDRAITALDSNGKKTRFMQQVKAELKLSNFTVVHSRVEDYYPTHLFDGITARAYATLADIVSSSGHLLTTAGTIWAMKGQIDPDELSALQKPYKVTACLPLCVPGGDAERHLVVIQPSLIT